MKKLLILLFAVLLTATLEADQVDRPASKQASMSAPTATATPVPNSTPKPYPTPKINLSPYLHEQGGKTITVTVGRDEDVGAKVNAAEARLQGPGKIVVRGGGSIK